MIALCMIVNGVEKEAAPLRQCLKSINKHVDGIFLTLTHKKGEVVSEKVKEVAEAFGANMSEFEWVNDFSKARNYNFSQVPKEYSHIMWVDADDVVRGAERLRKVVEENKDVDAFSMMYLYAFDEYKHPTVVHQKTRIVKNDGCVEWAGNLHEDFKHNRNITTKLVKDIEVLHMSNDKRFNESQERNVEVARAQMQQLPNDPRSYWNLANSLKAVGKDDEAIPLFAKFQEMSSSEDEKYIVFLRLAECYITKDDKVTALANARMALGMKPEYPDAYHLQGHIYAMMKNWERARDMFLLGLAHKPPYYDIIVYNPRDYDAVPLKALAKVYYMLNRPQDALTCLEGVARIYPDDKELRKTVDSMSLEAAYFESALKEVQRIHQLESVDEKLSALDALPENLQSHPHVCLLRNTLRVKEESSGKDLVIYCGMTAEEWTPETAIKKGIGGSEEAVVNLSRELVKLGWNVTVYNNCGHKPHVFDGVTFKPFWMWNFRDKQDVTILWRHPLPADYEINSTKVFLDVHDAIYEGEFTEQRLQKIDKIFVKSHFHRSLYPNVPDDKFVIIPNGIVSEWFAGETKKDPLLIVNTSSPDRGLQALIKGMRIIRKEIPDIKCQWAYGWGVYDIVHGTNESQMRWKQEIEQGMKDVGIEVLGRIGHKEVAELYKKASVLAYPTEFAEIDCISVTKAIATGAIPVTTDFSAIGEKQDIGVFVHSGKTKDNWGDRNEFSIEDDSKIEEWANGVITTIKHRPPEEEIERVRKLYQERYDWKNITRQWDDAIKG